MKTIQIHTKTYHTTVCSNCGIYGPEGSYTEEAFAMARKAGWITTERQVFCSRGCLNENTRELMADIDEFVRSARAEIADRYTETCRTCGKPISAVEAEDNGGYCEDCAAS